MYYLINSIIRTFCKILHFIKKENIILNLRMLQCNLFSVSKLLIVIHKNHISNTSRALLHYIDAGHVCI